MGTSSEFLSKPEVGGDVFIRETPDAIFTRESKIIDNTGGTDPIVLPAGYPMDDNVPVEASDIANTDGLLCQGCTVPAGQTLEVAVVQRGHVVINRDALPTTYYDTGGAINMTTFASTLTALGFVVRREPTTQAEQET